MSVILAIVYWWIVLFSVPSVILSTYYVVRYDKLTLNGFWYILKTAFIQGPLVLLFIIGEYVAHLEGYERLIARSMMPVNND